MRRLDMTFPSEPGRVRRATERVVRACVEAASGASTVAARLRVVVGEALANAVGHGNRALPHRRVRVTAEAEPGELRVAVEDEGEGFDADAPPDPTRPGRRTRPDGRGLHLQRRLADEVRHEDGGRRVVLVVRPEP